MKQISKEKDFDQSNKTSVTSTDAPTSQQDWCREGHIFDEKESDIPMIFHWVQGLLNSPESELKNGFYTTMLKFLVNTEINLLNSLWKHSQIWKILLNNQAQATGIHFPTVLLVFTLVSYSSTLNRAAIGSFKA